MSKWSKVLIFKREKKLIKAPALTFKKICKINLNQMK